MKQVRLSALRLFRRDESGQTTILLAAMMIMLLGFAGFVIDVGRCLYVYRELQASTDAAALAGAAELPASDAVAKATLYSSVAGNLNARTNIPGVTMVTGYPKVLCLNTLKSQGMACSSPGNGNAVQVRQQITLPLTFLKLVGKSSITMGAVATASMTGSLRAPYNVAIIVDTTPSMNTTDSDCGATRVTCALQGVQVLLHNLSPCAATLSSCGTVTNGNVAQPVDEVALYTFPGYTSASQAQYSYDCSSSTKPSGAKYIESKNFAIGTVPNPGSNLPAYKIVDYSSDYRTSNSATTLNSASNLVRAAGGVSGCAGLQATVSMNTYFAGVIYQAGYDLYVKQQARPGSQNVIILLGDGDANAPSSNMPYADNSGNFASYKNECQQAVNMAQLAYSIYGMRFYSVAYGAAASGCSTDVSGSNPNITPCGTMSGMASAPQYFYSDATATGGSSSCVSAAHSTLTLNQIFTQISGDLSVGRLIPDNTT